MLFRTSDWHSALPDGVCPIALTVLRRGDIEGMCVFLWLKKSREILNPKSGVANEPCVIFLGEIPQWYRLWYT